MRKLLFVSALFLSACASTPPHEGEVNPMPSEVQRVHARMLDAMGGRKAWEKARYFEFDFVVSRQGREASRWRHHWDRFTGDYRMSGVRGQDSVVVVTNVNTPTRGSAWVNRQPVTGARADSLLQFAFARWTNDSYWLIMPYKWTDPGVHTQFVGRQKDDTGREWDVVKLWFDQVGLTFQNQYLAFINPQTGLMERWYHFQREGADPSRYDWNKWTQFGPIKLAVEKPMIGGQNMIWFDRVMVSEKVPEGAFRP